MSRDIKDLTVNTQAGLSKILGAPMAKNLSSLFCYQDAGVVIWFLPAASTTRRFRRNGEINYKTSKKLITGEILHFSLSFLPSLNL